MKKYRKRPVAIEAVQVNRENLYDVAHWCGAHTNLAAKPSDHTDVAYWLTIPTLEGVMRADLGDWVIKGVEGEFYPCKPAIFDATYREVPEDDGRQRHELTRLVPDHWMSDMSTLANVRESMREEFLAAVGDRVQRLTWTIRVEGEDD
jgi:hypothetical protein